MEAVIPEHIVTFLDRATVGIGGTRGRNLVPHVHRMSGWSVSDDRQTLTCLVPEQFCDDLLPALEDNGQFALTVSEVPSHETYQFKGEFIRARPIEPRDVEVCERHRERFTESIAGLFGFPERALRAYVPPPSVAFDFALREIFVQTPGPDAGKRLVPPNPERGSSP